MFLRHLSTCFIAAALGCTTPNSDAGSKGQGGPTAKTIVAAIKRETVLREFLPPSARGCWVLVATSETCGVSRALGVNWKNEVLSSDVAKRFGVQTLWIVGDGSADSGNFRSVMRDVGVLKILPTPSEPLLFSLGVIGTPNTFVVNIDSHRLTVLAGNVIPSDSIIQTTCQSSKQW